jgi:hypothetical protein
VYAAIRWIGAEGLFTTMGFYDIVWPNCYQISLFQSYLSQLVINRFFYQAEAEYTDSLAVIASTFWGMLDTPLSSLVAIDLTFTEIQVLELFGDEQQYNGLLTDQVGLLAAPNLPAFFGSRIRFYPSDSRVRKGRKIFSGVVEDMVEENNLKATYEAAMTNLLAALVATLSVSEISFTPVMLSPANTRHTGNVVAAITAAQWAGWSTQGSRKVGRGA